MNKQSILCDNIAHMNRWSQTTCDIYTEPTITMYV